MDGTRETDDSSCVCSDALIDRVARRNHLIQQGFSGIPHSMLSLSRVFDSKQAAVFFAEDKVKPFASREHQMNAFEVMRHLHLVQQFNRRLSRLLHVCS